MKKILYTVLFCLGLSAFNFAAPNRVQATLGESAGSVESDMRTLSARRFATTSRNGYTVQEISYDSVKVREYVSSSGIVFGIAWNGFVHPDLTKLLGSYAEEYHAALRQMPRKHGQRPLEVKTNKVVVQQWGHMRNLQGRAYAPALIPPGVSVDEIK